MVLWSAALLWDWWRLKRADAWLPSKREAAFLRVSNVQLLGPEKLTGALDPRHALQKNEGLADLWYMDDG